MSSFTIEKINNKATITGVSNVTSNTALFIPEIIDGCKVDKIKKITIPSNIRNVTIDLLQASNLTTISAGAFQNCTAITSGYLRFPTNLTTIEANAFNGCNFVITDVNGSYRPPINLNHKLQYIGENAFKNCGFGGNLEIHDEVVSIGESAFLGSLFIGQLLLGAKLESIGANAFKDAFIGQNLNLNIPDNVITIGSNAFSGCVFGDYLFLGAKLRTIGASAFENCGFKYLLTIPDSVTDIGNRAFAGCKFDDFLIIKNGLKTIGISSFENCAFPGSLNIPDSVTDIGLKAFFNCGFKYNLNIGSGLKTIGSSAFENCGFSTGSLNIPDSVTDIGSKAFFNCGFKERLFLGSGLKTIGDSAFENCNFSGDLVIPSNVTDIGSRAFFNSGFDNCKLVLNEGLKTIGSSAFSGCGFVGDLTIPNSVTTIALGAFSNCNFNGHLTIGSGLSTIGTDMFKNNKFTGTLNIGQNISVIMSGAFENCTFHGDLVIPGSITDIGASAFSGCSFNGKLILSSGLKTIGASAFKNCTFDGDLGIRGSVTDIGDLAFSGCSFNGKLILSSGLKTIGTSAFEKCNFTGNLNIPNSVTNIGASAFSECDFNGVLSIGSGLLTVNEYTFKNCKFTGILTIPYNIKEIKTAAFSNSGFTSTLVILGSRLEKIGIGAFSSCGFTGDLVLPESVSSIGTGAFGSCTFTSVKLLGKLSKLKTLGINAFNSTIPLYMYYILGDLNLAIVSGTTVSVRPGSTLPLGMTLANNSIKSSAKTSGIAILENLSGETLTIEFLYDSVGISEFTSRHNAITIGDGITDIILNTDIEEFKIPAPTQTKTYILVRGGTLVPTKNITITVYPTPIITSFSVPTATTVGQQVGLNAVASGGTLEYSTDGFNYNNFYNNMTVSPKDTTTYRLKVTSPTGYSVVSPSTTLYVHGDPEVVSFTSNYDEITVGDGKMIILTPVFIRASDGHRIECPGFTSIVTSGKPISVPTPTSTTTYTLYLQHSNASGAPTYKESSLTITVYPTPIINSFTANPLIIDNGSSSQLTANVENGTMTYSTGPNDFQEFTSPKTVTPNTTTTYFLTVESPTGYSIGRPVSVQIRGPPIILSFTSNNASITEGDDNTLTLTGTFTGGSGEIYDDYSENTYTAYSGVPVTINSIQSGILNFSLKVTPSIGMSITRLISVSVAPAISIESFTSDSTTIADGSSTKLLASTTNAAFLSYSSDGGKNYENFRSPQFINPEISTSYILRATSESGYSVLSDPLLVTVTGPPIIHKEGLSKGILNYNTITDGDDRSVIINLKFARGTPVITSNPPGYINTSLESETDLIISPKPTVTTVYTLTLTGESVISYSTSLIVYPRPTIIKFEVDKPVIVTGSTTLTAVYQDGKATFSSDNGTTFGVLPTVLSPKTTTDYILKVTSPTGYYVTRTITVSVNGPPSISSFGTNYNAITNGDNKTITLTGRFVYGKGKIRSFPSGYSIDNIQAGSDFSLDVSPTPLVPTKYTLTVDNNLGNIISREISVNVYPTPAITTFTANPSSIADNSQTTLTTVVVNGVATLSSDGGTTFGVIPTGGKVSPKFDTTYVLKVTSPTGYYVTGSTSVTVSGQPFIESFTSNYNAVTVGDSKTITLKPKFHRGTATITSVSGTITSGEDIVISSTPSPGIYTYTLTVTGTGQPAVSSITVTVHPTPTIILFQAQRSTISLNSSTLLNITKSGGTASISSDGGSTFINLTTNSISPKITTTYILKVTSPTGYFVLSDTPVVVNVSPIASIVSFTANYSALTVGDDNSLVLKANFTGETGIISSNTSTFSGAIVSGVDLTLSQSPISSTDYTLTVTNSAGDTTTRVCKITVYPTPTAVLNTSVTSINLGQSVDITTSTSNGVVTFSADGGLTFSNVVPRKVSPIETTTYMLKVTSQSGYAVFSSPVTITVLGPAVIKSFTTNYNAITIEDTKTIILNTSFIRGISASIVSNPVGYTNNSVTSGSSITISPNPATVGIHIYTLTVGGNTGSPAIATVKITVYPKPTITTFTAKPSSIPVGSQTTLTTVVANGVATLSSDGGTTFGALPVGGKVKPILDTTYTLKATNPTSYYVTGTTPVVVTGPAVIVSFTSNYNAVTVGDDKTITLKPKFYRGTATITSVSGTITSGEDITISPTPNPGTHTYVLTVTGNIGKPAVATIKVTVYPTPSIVISRYAYTITMGSQATLTSTISNGIATLTTDYTGVFKPFPAGGKVSPKAATTYVIKAASPTGYHVLSNRITVNVVNPPAISIFTSNYNAITVGDNSSIVFQIKISNGTGVITSSPQSFTCLINETDSYIKVSEKPIGTTTYTLTVTNEAGTSVTKTVKIAVYPRPTITFSAGQQSITAGSSVNLNAVVSNGVVTLSTDSRTYKPFSPIVKPIITTTYYAKVTSPSGYAIEPNPVTVTVTGPPVILSFGSSDLKNTFTVGETLVLKGEFGRGTGAITSNPSTFSGNIESGLDLSIFPTPTVTTTYTLTVNGTGTPAVSTFKVTVYPRPTITTFSALPLTITAGSTSKLTVNTTGGVAAISSDNGRTFIPVPPTVSPKVTTSYYLKVTSPSGFFELSNPLIINVVQPPVISSFVILENSSVVVGDDKQITVKGIFIGGTSVISNTLGYLVKNITSGNPFTITPRPNTPGKYVYTLTVINELGTEVKKTVTVTVRAS
jgi:hypothetical protein